MVKNFEWEREKEEKIQMHADKLYHQMLDYEARVEQAKAAGVEPPPIKSLFNPNAEPIPSQAEDGVKGPNGAVVIPGGIQVPLGMKTSKPLKGYDPP
ncbi:predicted protein [Uncinocarpus reesii 1704]|uniref:Uncharacterized protein n=1 Tax=Uncinocarpus reesii (strain UAMH 1704) TaxID=336963 RepID=C4JFB2_UNCRE|nr:uncharacterized protein UREG_02334 [Uncinocarpus reesii 1704]EEP77485.1 predicted protein [Uncinocarpus reesii 1704]